MRKFTFLLALLLSFVGVASAQEASGSVYDDPTTAPGVTPALSTADGTQFAYYLRNVQYPTSFLGVANVAATSLALVTDNASSAVKVAVEKTSNGFTFYTLLDDNTRSGNKIKSGTQAPKVWVDGLTNDIYQWTITYVDVDHAYTFKSESRNRYLYAKTATQTQDTQDLTLYGAFSSYVKHMGWQFIPANDAAKKAAALTINVAAGDDVHGNLATFSASYPVAKPEGYSVYTASYDAGTSSLNMTELEGDVIPGNTGVILKGNVNSALSMQPSLTVPTTVESALTPTNEATKEVTAGETVYGLGVNSSNVLALYKLSAGTIGANKAYYTAEAGTPAIALNFGGDVTGISNAQVTNNVNAPMFDLSGRRVVKAVKGGLYIQNGKKFIVK